MSDQPNQTTQPAQHPRELRQQMLEQLETSKQAIEELSDEELEEVAGGWLPGVPGGKALSVIADAAQAVGHGAKTFWNSQVSKSGAAVLSASGTGVGINNSGKK